LKESDEASGLPVFRYAGDEARLMGGEFSASIDVTGSLVLDLGFDYVDGRDHLSRVAERNFPMPGRNFSLAYRLFF
jgi:hypothetical protein